MNAEEMQIAASQRHHSHIYISWFKIKLNCYPPALMGGLVLPVHTKHVSERPRCSSDCKRVHVHNTTYIIWSDSFLCFQVFHKTDSPSICSSFSALTAKAAATVSITELSRIRNKLQSETTWVCCTTFLRTLVFTNFLLLKSLMMRREWSALS